MNQLKPSSIVEKGDIILLPIIYRENFQLDIGFYYKNTVKNLHYCYVLDEQEENGKKVFTVVPFNSTREKYRQRRKMVTESKIMNDEKDAIQKISYKFGELENGIYYIETDKLPYLTAPITHDSHLDFGWRLRIVNYSGLSFFVYKKKYYPELFVEISEILKNHSINYEFGMILSSTMNVLFDLHLVNSLKSSRQRRI